MPNMIKDFYAPCDIARLNGISVRTVLRAIENGELRARRYNRRVVIVPRSALVEWVAAKERAAVTHFVRSKHNSHKSESS